MYTSKLSRAKRRELSKAFSAAVKRDGDLAWICIAIRTLKDESLREDAFAAVSYSICNDGAFIPQALFGADATGNAKTRLRIRRQWLRIYVEKGVAFNKNEIHPYRL